MTSGFFQISSNIQINIAVGETFYRQRIPSIDSNLFIILEIPVKTENNNQKASDYNRSKIILLGARGMHENNYLE